MLFVFQKVVFEAFLVEEIRRQYRDGENEKIYEIECFVNFLWFLNDVDRKRLSYGAIGIF